jgi:predicted permease
MNAFAHDVRFALRLLRRSPGFALGVVSILGLGIAAATALFSIVDAAILRPLPFRDPGRLVAVVSEDRIHHVRNASSPPDLVDFRASVPALSAVAATTPWSPAATGEGEPERLRGLLVSANFFSLLGVGAARGRTFDPAEEMPGRERVVVVADALWRRRYGADPRLVGRAILLNGEPYTVVGIAPPGFRWGRSYGRNGTSDLWAPFALTPERLAAGERGDEYLDLFGRIRTGVPLPEAQAQVDALMRRFQRDYPDQFPPGSPFRTTLVSLQRDLVGDTRKPLWILFGAVGFLLLIACTNVGGLLLARAAKRRAEIAIRISLGASKARLFTQLLAESAVVTLISAAAGAVAAWGLLRIAGGRLPPDFPGVSALSVDARVLSFVLALSAITTVAFGLVPLAGSSAFDLRRRIDEGRGVAARGEGRLRRALVAGQLGLAALLLVGAGLLALSVVRILRVDPGFDAKHVITGELSLPRDPYSEPTRREAFRKAVIDRLLSAPGVTGAGVVSVLPFGADENSSSFDIEGRPDLPGNLAPHGENWAATPGYFPAMRIPLLRGRSFVDSDGPSSVPVAIVDDTLARAYFGSQDPIGHRIDFEGSDKNRRWRVIVGVVRTVRTRSLGDAPRPSFYVPFSQSHERVMTFVARVRGSAAATAATVRAAVSAADPGQPLGIVAPLEELVSESVAQRRAAAAVIAAFAAAAMLLAGIGLYGVLAYSVARRRREIGIRMALGAVPSAIASLVLRESGRMISTGLAGGLAAAFLLTRFLGSLLFGVAPLDPLAFGTVAAVLSGVGLLATVLPARRAARTPPMEALRDE